MKKLFPISQRYWLALILVVTTLFLVPTDYGLAQDTSVLLSPASAEVDVGNTTTVDIRIENVTNLYGAEVHLSFDPALLEVEDSDEDMAEVQVQPGSFLAPDFTAQNRVDLEAGTIDFAISQMAPTEAVSGSGVLATITFKGKASGTSDLNFSSVTLSDQGGEEIDAGSQNGSVTVNSGETPTEEPTETPDVTVTPTETPDVTVTPTETPDVTVTPIPGDILGYHTVKSGETLYCIARAYGVDPYAIAEENGILNPNLIYAGQELAIPDVPKALPSGHVCPRQFNEEDEDCRWYHTVVSGENLYRISLHYDVSMYAIADANNISNLNLIYAGDTLCIP